MVVETLSFAGNAISVVGSAVAATAKNIPTVIAGCVLIGLAGAFRQIAWASLGELVPRTWRSTAFGMLSTLLSASSTFGPLIGMFPTSYIR
jgi:MFS family permease